MQVHIQNDGPVTVELESPVEENKVSKHFQTKVQNSNEVKQPECTLTDIDK